MAIAKNIYRHVWWKGMYHVSNFLLNILITRYFGAASSGHLYYLVTVFALVHLVSSVSVEAGITYFASKNELDHGKLFSFSILWTLVSGLLIAAFLWNFHLSDYPDITQSRLILYAVFFVCGNLLSQFCSGLFYSQGNFITPNVLPLLVNVALIACLLFINKAGNTTDHTFFNAYFGSFFLQGLLTMIAFYLTYKQKLILQSLSSMELKKLLRFSLLAWAGNLAFFFLYRVDYWFVERYCSAADLGNYIQVSKLGQLFFLLPSMLSAVIFPSVASNSNQEMPYWLALISRAFLFVYGITCILLIGVGHWMFPAIFGNEFNKMHEAFIFLVPGILALTSGTILAAYYGGRNKLKENIQACLLSLLVVLIGNSILVPRFGINAAALVSSLGYILYLVYILHDLKKSHRFSLGSFFIFRWKDIITLKEMLRMRNSSANLS